MSRKMRKAVMELSIHWEPSLVDGRTLSGLKRQGLAEIRPLIGWDGRSLQPLADGRQWPRRMKLAKLTRLGRTVRDFYMAKAARRLDRERRRPRVQPSDRHEREQGHSAVRHQNTGG